MDWHVFQNKTFESDGSVLKEHTLTADKLEYSIISISNIGVKCYASQIQVFLISEGLLKNH